MRARIRVAALGFALALAFCFCCTGCVFDGFWGVETTQQGGVDMSDEVTERDIEMAEQLEAPSYVDDALAQGEWDSIISRRTIRDAEAAEDYLSARYGVEFRATEVSQHGGIKTNNDMVYLTVASGDFEGAECKCSFYPYGTPEWADSYLYVRLHEEYESVVLDAAEPAFSDLPAGTWVCRAAMSDGPYYEVMSDPSNEEHEVVLPPDASLEEAGPFVDGDVYVYLSPDSAISEEEFQQRMQEMAAALEGTGVCVCWHGLKITQPLDGAEFTAEWAEEAARHSASTWYVAGIVSGLD